ncbi:hypothetical protein ACFE04_002299 [Oxalis oulophora]
MVSDSELIERLQSILRVSDLNTTTTGSVRRMLEQHFNIDLTDKKQFIRDQIEEGKELKLNWIFAPLQMPKKPKKRGGFTKLCSLSPKLQEFVGVPEMARTEVVKALWAYIREKNLQDPSNRQNILCDEQLRSLFNVDRINMFQMNKALTKHIWPLDSDDVLPDKSAQKEKPRKQETEEEEEDAPKKPAKKQKPRKQETEEEEEAPVKPTKKKKRKQEAEEADSDEPKAKKATGFLAPLKLSDALVEFLGTGERELSRSEVVKRMWAYIKLHNLQDPSDKRMIICDEKLKKLFDVESFTGFTVSKLLTTHLVKT